MGSGIRFNKTLYVSIYDGYIPIVILHCSKNLYFAEQKKSHLMASVKGLFYEKSIASLRAKFVKIVESSQ